MQNKNQRIDLGITPIGNTIRDDVSCSRCPASCCRTGTRIQLAYSEAESLRSSGTQLKKDVDFPKWRWGMGMDEDVYTFVTDCGNLVRDELGRLSCGIYDQPAPIRPEVCQQFPAGSENCITSQNDRADSGEDVFVPPPGGAVA